MTTVCQRKQKQKIVGENFTLVTTLQKYICWWVKKKLELSIFHSNVIYFLILRLYKNDKHILGGITFFSYCKSKNTYSIVREFYSAI